MRTVEPVGKRKLRRNVQPVNPSPTVIRLVYYTAVLYIIQCILAIIYCMNTEHNSLYFTMYIVHCTYIISYSLHNYCICYTAM